MAVVARSGWGQGPADREWIGYSPDLIASLKAEHGALMRMFGELGELAVCGRYRQIVAALDEFRVAFEAHVLNENLRFYCYLEQRLAGSEAERELVARCRAELSGVAREVTAFLRKYRRVGVRFTNAKAFQDELHCVGALLVHRVDREETGLFPLYRP